jgi:hypothetical protein
MKPEYYQLPVELMGRAVDAMDVKDPKVYGNYLAQTYYYVSHSTRMLAFAGGLMKRQEEPHFRRFIKHISEEVAHDLLAEKDLHDLGMKPVDFQHLPETRAFWEPQYYKMQFEHPLALMGYIIALESFATVHLPRFYQKAKETYHGKACRFIQLHAEEDPDHIDKAIQLTSTLSPELQELVLINIIQSAKSYVAMVKACDTPVYQASNKTIPQFYHDNKIGC